MGSTKTQLLALGEFDQTLSRLVDTPRLWAPTVAQVSQLRTHRHSFKPQVHGIICRGQQRAVGVGTVSVTILPRFLRYSRLCSEDSRAGSCPQERENAGEGHCLGPGMQTCLTLAKVAVVSRFSTPFSDTDCQDIVQAGFEFTMQP